MLFPEVTNEHEMQVIDFKYVTSLFFLILVPLKAQCHQKLNVSVTCSRFNLWLHDVLLQKVASQLSDPSRRLLRTFLRNVLLFRSPDSFPRCMLFLDLHHIPVKAAWS